MYNETTGLVYSPVIHKNDMHKDLEEIELLDSIYETFPEVAKDLDYTLKYYWEYEPHERNEMWTGLIERFSQLTTDAIEKKDEKTAKKYLSFMESKYMSGGDNCKNAIDVYYVESLLWSIKDLKIKKWGWSLIPNVLQKLYTAMWGEPKFK